MDDTIRSFPTPSRVHLALEVEDVARCSKFYEAFFGVAPSKVRAGYAKFEVNDPPLNFTLNQRVPGTEPARRGSLAHYGIEVKNIAVVTAGVERLHAAGMAPRPEDAACCYAQQSKFWINDPEGNPWEVFVVLGDVDHPSDLKPVEAKPAEAKPGGCGCATT